MRQVIVTVPDKKFSFFIELVKNLGFAEAKEAEAKETKKKTLQHIEKGLQEVKLMRTGKLPKNKIQNLLREL